MADIFEQPVMSLSIDPFPEADLEEGARLYRTVFNSPPWNDEWTLATARRRLSEIVETPGYRGYRASLDAELVGVLLGNLEQWYSGEHFHLKELFVRPSRQRRGIGTALIEFLADELRREGVERIYLLTLEDSPARSFYETNGFRRNEAMGMQSLHLEN